MNENTQDLEQHEAEHNEAESMTRSIRGTKADFDTLKRIAEELGMSQGAAFAQLLATYELHHASDTMSEQAANVKAAQSLLAQLEQLIVGQYSAMSALENEAKSAASAELEDVRRKLAAARDDEQAARADADAAIASAKAARDEMKAAEAAKAEAEKKAATADAEAAEAKSMYDALKQAAADARSERDHAKAAAENAKTELDSLKAEIENLRDAAKAAETAKETIAELKQELAEAKQERREANKELNELVREFNSRIDKEREASLKVAADLKAENEKLREELQAAKAATHKRTRATKQKEEKAE